MSVPQYLQSHLWEGLATQNIIEMEKVEVEDTIIDDFGF